MYTVSVEDGDHRKLLLIGDLQLDSHVCQFGQICMCVISILRFLTDHRVAIPLAVTTRMLETHDAEASERLVPFGPQNCPRVWSAVIRNRL